MTISGDTSDSDAAPAQSAAAGPGVWAETTFFRIIAILGRRRAESLLTDYVGYLRRAEAEIEAARAEAVALRRTLHDLRSTSGILGFNALSELSVVMLSNEVETPSPESVARLLDLTSESLQAARRYLTAPDLTAAA